MKKLIIIILMSLSSHVLAADEIILKCKYAESYVYPKYWPGVIVISLDKETSTALVFDSVADIPGGDSFFSTKKTKKIKDPRSAKFETLDYYYNFTTQTIREEITVREGPLFGLIKEPTPKYYYRINRKNLFLKVKKALYSRGVWFRDDEYNCVISDYSFKKTMKLTIDEEIQFVKELDKARRIRNEKERAEREKKNKI